MKPNNTFSVSNTSTTTDLKSQSETVTEKLQKNAQKIKSKNKQNKNKPNKTESGQEIEHNNSASENISINHVSPRSLVYQSDSELCSLKFYIFFLFFCFFLKNNLSKS